MLVDNLNSAVYDSFNTYKCFEKSSESLSAASIVAILGLIVSVFVFVYPSVKANIAAIRAIEMVSQTLDLILNKRTELKNFSKEDSAKVMIKLINRSSVNFDKYPYQNSCMETLKSCINVSSLLDIDLRNIDIWVEHGENLDEIIEMLMDTKQIVEEALEKAKRNKFRI